jgi:hypothetical protein
MRTSRTPRRSRAPRRTALGAGLAAAALALLPAAAASADTTIQLVEDDPERYVDYVDDSPVAVAPGATLTVPAPPDGAWESGFELLLFEIGEFGSLSEVDESSIERTEGPVAAGDPEEPPVLSELPEALPEDAEEVALLAESASEDEGVVVGGMIESTRDGGVQVVLGTDVPEGSYSASLFATGEDLSTYYYFFFSLEVVDGGATTATLDYRTAEQFTVTTFFISADVVVTPGERVTLVAPPGVDLNTYGFELSLFGDGALDYPYYLPDEVDLTITDDGGSLTFVLPTTLPDQRDGSEPAPLPEGTALSIYLYEFSDVEQVEFTDYVVGNLTVGPVGGSGTTRPPIPTAVPAGEGPLPDGGPGTAVLAAAGFAGAAALGVGTLLMRRRAGAGTHR